MRVFVTEAIHPDALALLRMGGCDVVEAGVLSAGERADALREAEAVLVRVERLPDDAMAAPLRLVSKHGTGVDNIPLAAARTAGVCVMNTPGANAAAVAEHALALILALAKRLPAMQAAARTGRALLDPQPPLLDLAGRKLLVVGYGASGRRLGALAAALGMEVLVHSRSFSRPGAPARTDEGWRVVPDLAAALPEAEVLSLHCPLTHETRRMIGATEIARLPAGALVVNTARGGLIDEAALAAAGHLGGIGLDVGDTEPFAPDHPLQGHDDAILTPHIAGVTAGAFRAMGMAAARNVLAFRDGAPDPAHVVVPGR